MSWENRTFGHPILDGFEDLVSRGVRFQVFRVDGIDSSTPFSVTVQITLIWSFSGDIFYKWAMNSSHYNDQGMSLLS